MFSTPSMVMFSNPLHHDLSPDGTVGRGQKEVWLRQFKTAQIFFRRMSYLNIKLVGGLEHVFSIYWEESSQLT